MRMKCKKNINANVVLYVFAMNYFFAPKTCSEPMNRISSFPICNSRPNWNEFLNTKFAARCTNKFLFKNKLITVIHGAYRMKYV